jgi:alcohol dehydrogenase
MKAHVTMEAVGLPESFEEAVALVRPGGHVASRQLDSTAMITHRFAMDEFEAAYDVFGRPAETGALKVLLTGAKQQAKQRL